MATTELLHRSVSDARVAGVCGGLAEHFRVDPLLVRIAAVIIALSSGVGVVLYGAAWLLLPRGTETPALVKAFPPVSRVGSRGWTAIVATAAVAVIVVVGGVLGVSLVPTVLVLGILYATQLRPSRSATVISPAPAPYAADTTWPGGQQWPLMPTDDVVITTPAGPWRPTNRYGRPLSAQECARFYAVPDPAHLFERQPAAPARRGRTVAVVTGILAAALFAALSLLGAFVHVDPVIYLAVGLSLVGGGLVVGAFVGRPPGFIAIAIALVLVAGMTSADVVEGRDTQAVTAYALASDLPASVDASGDYELDLSATDVDVTRTVSLTVTDGDVTVILPATGSYVVTWDVPDGSVTLPDGAAASSGRYAPTSNASPTLTVEVSVAGGDLEVSR